MGPPSSHFGQQLDGVESFEGFESPSDLDLYSAISPFGSFWACHLTLGEHPKDMIFDTFPSFFIGHAQANNVLVAAQGRCLNPPEGCNEPDSHAMKFSADFCLTIDNLK